MKILRKISKIRNLGAGIEIRFYIIFFRFVFSTCFSYDLQPNRRDFNTADLQTWVVGHATGVRYVCRSDQELTDKQTHGQYQLKTSHYFCKHRGFAFTSVYICIEEKVGKRIWYFLFTDGENNFVKINRQKSTGL